MQMDHAEADQLGKPIERRFRSALRSGQLLAPADRVLVGLSGGPDSSALLLLLCRWAGTTQHRVEAAHFDHQIRDPMERAAEREAVQSLAEHLHVPLHEGAGDIPSSARREHRSYEEQSRIERYRFLKDVAINRGIGAVAVGHTASDQIETILLHLIRGSGLKGLAGMSIEQPWVFGPGPRLLRPLLGFTRAETEAYCKIRGVEPHRDSQNLSAAYLRNRVRAEILPLLSSFNPAVGAAILRLGRAASVQEALLDALCCTILPRLTSGQDKLALLTLDQLRDLPEAVRVELFLRAYAIASGDRRGLSSRHVEALSKLVLGSAEGSLDLPRSIRAHLEGGRVSLTRRAGRTDRQAGEPPSETELSIPGQTQWGPWSITACFPEAMETHWASEPYSAVFDADQLVMPIIVRSRLPGDRIRPLGMHGNKKVQDVLVDAHIPRSQRDRIPIICSQDTVLWVAGVRRSAHAPITPRTSRSLSLVAQPKPQLE